MKHFLSFLLLLLTLSSFGQSVTDSLEREQYCIIRVDYRMGGDYVDVSFDNGQGIERRLRENGKIKHFGSEVAALNYFGNQGWKLVSAFPVIGLMQGTGNSYTRYVFKKNLLREASSKLSE
jgi:hypothetical protein